MVVHVAGPADVGRVVVGPLPVAVVGALGLAGGGVGNVPVLLLEQRSRGTPVPNTLRPFRICLIAGIECQAGGKLEQTTIGDGVLGGVATLVGPNLPAHASVTTAGVPAGDLGVENTLREGQPGRLSVSLGEIQLGSGDGGQTPENLVIIPQVVAIVARKKVVVALLEVHAVLDRGIELIVAGQPPVLDENHEHRPALPPGPVELSGDIFGLAGIVVGHHILGDRLRRSLDGI